MKILFNNAEARETVRVKQVIVFDPWPFVEDELEVTLGFIATANDYRPPNADWKFVLAATFDRALAVLSDGTVAVCNPDDTKVGDIITGIG